MIFMTEYAIVKVGVILLALESWTPFSLIQLGKDFPVNKIKKVVLLIICEFIATLDQEHNVKQNH